MIAGALIISLFFLIANNQAQASQDRLAANALQQVNTILSTQATSFDTSTRVPIPNDEIRIVCEAFRNNNQITLLSQLEIGGFSRVLENDLIVGRDIQANQLILFSKDWRAPYRAGNVLHVSSDNELLVLKDVDSLAQSFEALQEAFPDAINQQEYTTGTTIDARGYSRVRVVALTDQSAPLNAASIFNGVIQDHPQAHFILVKMDTSVSNDVLATGEVYYYPRSDSRIGPYRYTGEAMLTGLIWQASPQEADCLQHKLSVELARQTTLQLARVQELITAYSDAGNQACESLLGPGRLVELRDEATRLTSATQPLYAFDIYNQAQEVTNQNERLLRGERCATIY